MVYIKNDFIIRGPLKGQYHCPTAHCHNIYDGNAQCHCHCRWLYYSNSPMMNTTYS